MDDLISRKALIEEFNLWYERLGGTMNQKNWIVQDTISSAIDTINEARGVDAEPVRYGEWIHLGGDEWCCNNCGEVIHTEGSWEPPSKKFCYECGAKMRCNDETE